MTSTCRQLHNDACKHTRTHELGHAGPSPWPNAQGADAVRDVHARKKDVHVLKKEPPGQASETTSTSALTWVLTNNSGTPRAEQPRLWRENRAALRESHTNGQVRATREPKLAAMALGVG